MLAAVLLALLPAGPEPMDLEVDLREAPRRQVHARMTIPARPGPLTLVYPKWIPGEHGPTGPIADLAGLRISVGGRPLAWSRDDVDLHSFRVEVPPGARSVEVALDYLAAPPGMPGFSTSSSYSAQVAVLSWYSALVYPKGAAARDLPVRAALRLPAGWGWGSALAVVSAEAGRVAFETASLETLVDSPVLAGRFLREIAVGPPGEPSHALVVAAESEAALAAPGEWLEKLGRLVAEAQALFGSRHYRRYRFLLALSNQVAHFGLEHHESSDNRVPERMFLDPEVRAGEATLLPHEYVHSWNGKYRRPRGLVSPDFQEPVRTSLLWVYEGLAHYLGTVLAARSGFLSPEDFRGDLALQAGGMAEVKGRAWRPLGDTATAAQVLYGSRDEGASLRRGVDFYWEGTLLWLEADVLIRERSGGARSLDDFCRAFFGGPSGPPEVRPYDLGDLVSALGAVQRHDWKAFFAERLDRVAEAPPMAGLERGGWRLGWAAEPGPVFRAWQKRKKWLVHGASLGLVLGEKGEVVDVVPGSPADRAGVPSAGRVVAVDGRRYAPEVLADALAATPRTGRVELLVENADLFRAHVLEWSGGPRYPTLERIAERPDLLSVIGAPRAGP